MEGPDWKSQTLVSLFNVGAACNGEHPCVIYDDGQTSVFLTYRSLKEASVLLANELRTHDRCENEVVCIVMQPGLLLPAILIGVIGIPAAFYTLNVASAAKERIRNIFCRLRIRIIITDSSEVISRLKEDLFEGYSLTVRSLNVLGHDVFIMAFDNTLWSSQNCVASTCVDLAYVITTSGTTGIPKIVKVPHRCIVPNILHISQVYSLTEADLVLQASPLTFDPSIVEIFTTFYAGATLLMVPDSVKLQPRSLVHLATERQKVTVLQATPSLISSIASFGILRSTLLSAGSALRLLVFGGEPCPNGLTIKSWRQLGNSTQFINIYGITEVSSWATFYKLTEEDIESCIEEVPLGSVLLGTELELRDVTEDSVGQLWIGGEDRVCLIDDENCTLGSRCMRFSGDYVRQTGSGSLYYVGRKDDMVKRNGKRLHLHEIEKIVSNVIGVHGCVASYERNSLLLFVHPSPDETTMRITEGDAEIQELKQEGNGREGNSTGEEDVPSHLEGKSDLLKSAAGMDLTAKDIDQPKSETRLEIKERLLPIINEQLLKWLPDFSHPDIIHFVSDMPLTNHGKVDKRRLLKTYFQLKPSKPSLWSDGGIKTQLTQIWRKYIAAEVPCTKTFVESGGNSIMALSLAEDISNLFSIRGTQILDKVLHGTLEDVVGYLTAVLDVPGETNGSDAFENGIDATETSVTSNPLLFDHLAGDWMKSGTHRSSFSLPSGKRRKFDSNDAAGITRQGKVPDYSADEDSANAFKAVLSVQKGSCSFSYEDFHKTHPGIKDFPKCFLKMEVGWKYDTGKCVDASPLIVCQKNGEKIIYIGSHSHRFAALSLDSGAVVWDVVLGDRVESSACLSHCGRYVIAGCYDGKVYFLDRFTGHSYWTFQTGNQVKCSPCVNLKNGLVYIGSHDQNLYALDPRTKSCVWKRNLDGTSVFSSPLLNPETYKLVAATLGGRLVLLNPDTGDVLYQFDVGKPLFSSPASTAHGYVIGCVDGAVYSISGDGKKVWSYITGGPVFSSPCVSKATLSSDASQENRHVDATQDTGIISLDSSNKDFPLPSSPSSLDRKCEGQHIQGQQGCEEQRLHKSQETHEEQILYEDQQVPHLQMEKVTYTQTDDAGEQIITFGCHDCRIHCLSANTGTLIWNRLLDSEVYSTPFSFTLHQAAEVLRINCETQALDLVAVCSSKGVLYIFENASGDLLGKFHLPGEIFSSPCVSDSRLVFGCRDNFVYCIHLSLA